MLDSVRLRGIEWLGLARQHRPVQGDPHKGEVVRRDLDADRLRRVPNEPEQDGAASAAR